MRDVAAIWGAVTGTLALILGVVNLTLARRIRVRLYPEIVSGNGDWELKVDIVSVSDRPFEFDRFELRFAAGQRAGGPGPMPIEAPEPGTVVRDGEPATLRWEATDIAEWGSRVGEALILPSHVAVMSRARKTFVTRLPTRRMQRLLSAD